MGFKQCAADSCLYTKNAKGIIVYLLIYVDDILVYCVDESIINVVYSELENQFEITDLDDLSHFLGMQVRRVPNGYSVSLEGYITQVVEKFGLRDAKEANGIGIRKRRR